MASAEKKSNASGSSANDRTRRASRSARFVVCIDDTGYPASLQRHKIYRVLSDKEALLEGDLRVIDDSGEDYLYSTDRFVAVKLPAAVRASMVARARS